MDFLIKLRDVIPRVEMSANVFMSDRKKRLLEGIETMFPKDFHSFYSWHMKKNMKSYFKEELAHMFNGLVYATIEE